MVAVLALVLAAVPWPASAYAPRGVPAAAGRRPAPRPSVVEAVEAAPEAGERRVCAMLSLNARGVSRKAVRAAEAALGAEHVFATGSLDEAEVAAKTIVDRGYGYVVAGGGDGTLSSTIRFLRAAHAGRLDALPAIAALPLGTGNAVSRYALGAGYRRWCGARGVARACAELRTRGEVRTLRVPVIEVDSGELCFIAGQGYDAFILDDYERLVRQVRGTPLSKPLASVFGYFVATALRTLPGYLRGERHMRVRVSSPAAAWVDARRGDAALPVSDRGGGDVLYEGAATIVAGGTTPFYGGGLRLFPFARSDPTGKLHLRVATMSPWRFVPNVLGVFAGHYRAPAEAFDFLGDEFTVALLDGKRYPFQQSGDAVGARREFTLRVAGAVTFVDFLGPPEPLAHLVAH